MVWEREPKIIVTAAFRLIADIRERRNRHSGVLQIVAATPKPFISNRFTEIQYTEEFDAIPLRGFRIIFAVYCDRTVQLDIFVPNLIS